MCVYYVLCSGTSTCLTHMFTQTHILNTFISTYPINMKPIGAPQMTSQPISSIFLCSSMPSGTSWTPGLSIPWCCLPTFFSACLVFFPLSRCLARQFWSDLMNGRHVHTTSVCVYYGQKVYMWSDCLLNLGIDFLIGNMVFVWDEKYLWVAPHFYGSYSSL